MPLRGHFRPPVETRMSWEGFHAVWPANIASRLMQQLPKGDIAEPRSRPGTNFEVGVGGHVQENWADGDTDLNDAGGEGATATAVLAPPAVSVVTELDDQYEYEVRVYDQHRARQLVTVVERVGPANMDRPESRQAVVTKCAALLQEGVSVCLIDRVTTRHFNIYAESSAFLRLPPPTAAGRAEGVYAVACRGVQRRERKTVFQAWPHELQVGHPLPTLPLWLTRDVWVPLELAASYEETCRTYRLPLPAPTSPPSASA